MSSLQSVRRENKRLRSKLKESYAAIVDRDQAIEKLANDLNELKAYVNRVLARRGGKSSRDHEDQGQLFATTESVESDEGSDAVSDELETDPEADEDDDGPAQDAAEPKGRSRKPRGPKLVDTSGLPCEEQVHELPPEKQVCPITGEPLIPVGEKIFKEVEYRRAKLLVVIHKRVIYGPPQEIAKERKIAKATAPMPPRALEDCAASATLLAWILVQKYANHLPLYRQQAIFARDGLRIARQTLCDWTLAAAAALEPIVNCLMTKIRAGPVMQLDDTPVMCQRGRGEKQFQAYLWTFVNPEQSGCVYRFTEGRSSELLARELDGFTGTLVGDGYSGNRAAARKVEGPIKLAGCYAHTTRKFRDASDAPGSAQLFRNDIKQLYIVEKEADDAELSAEERLELRYRKSRSILARLLARARSLRGSFSESGKMADALGYFLNQRGPLRRFLEDGRIPLDNNACERAIRPIAIGRRNWLFAGSPRGGRAAATVYSVLESCKIADIDPISYLADVLVRVATHPASRVEDLLPENWTATASKSEANAPESTSLPVLCS